MLTENPLAPFKYCPRCGSQDCKTPEGENSLRCPECGLSYYANVASAVAGFVVDGQGNLLAVRRGREPAKGTLDLPGGFVSPLETVEEAMKRELEEETGLIAQSIQYIWSIPNIYPYSGINVYTSDLFFVVKVESFEEALASDDASEIVILPIGELNPEEFGLLSIREAVGRLQRDWTAGLIPTAPKGK